MDPDGWAQESLGIAKESVYSLRENDAPSPDYVRKCEDISARRVAFAGYRLAKLLQSLMS